MNSKNKAVGVALYGSLLAFISFVVYILAINQEVFYTVHERSEFSSGAPFFEALMLRPFGFMQYVGAWLTQFFHSPVLGTCLMLAMWALIFFVGKKAFRLEGSASALMLMPVACLIASVVDLGYWVYIHTICGYYFSQTVAFIVMLTLLWAARCTPRKWHLLWYIAALCSYPVLGWYAMLFVVCLIVTEKPSWGELLAIVLLFFTASIWRTILYSYLKLEDIVLAGLPHFMTANDCSESLSVPFWALGALTILISLCGRYLAKWFIPICSAIASIIFIVSFMFNDRNYINEMRMVRNASDDNWAEVLKISEETKTPTISMVMLKNIALMNEGGLLDRSFKMGNNSVSVTNPDSLHVSFLEIAAPVVYYNYGMMNEATRLDFECSVQAGFCPFYLKILSRCALATGEENLMKRYTTMLHGIPFYSNWQPAPVTENVRILQKSYSDELTGVENSDSYIVNNISLWYESDNKLASEQALFFSMLRCDSKRFWASLRKFVNLHQNENFPLHAQEAYILYMDKAPEEKRMMLPVEQSTYDRYTRFWNTLENKIKSGKSRSEVTEEMRGDWGDTYWYFNLFGRKIL